ncbi:MAG: Flp pilus assembly protein CpaB [Actinomycetota bacterium]
MSNDGKTLRRRIWSRFGTAHLIAVAAGLVTAVLLLAWTRGQEQVTPVLLAAEDIRAGTIVEASDLRVAEIPSDPTVVAAVYPAESLDGLVGQVASRSISESEPILRSDLRPVATEEGLRAMSVPLPLANAVGGDLAVGDEVDVLVVGDTGTRFVAEAVQVLAVPDTESSGLVGAGSAWWVVLAVEDGEALQIADGVENGTVYLLRSTGTPDLVNRELQVPDEPAEPPPEAASTAEGE